jgi:hypothetical protein
MPKGRPRKNPDKEREEKVKAAIVEDKKDGNRINIADLLIGAPSKSAVRDADAQENNREKAAKAKISRTSLEAKGLRDGEGFFRRGQRITKRYAIADIHRCTSCAVEYKTIARDFYKSPSFLFMCNDGYFPVCRKCLDELYRNLVMKIGEKPAMRRCCQLLDWFYSEEILAVANARDEPKALDRYEKANLILGVGRSKRTENASLTYFDTAMTLAEPITKSDKEREKEFSGRWGFGRTLEEYEALESHYAELKTKCNTYDPVQEAQVVSACNAWLCEQRAYIAGDAAAAKNFHGIFKSAVESAQLELKEENSADDVDSWSRTLLEIEKHCPAEFYRDKKLYEDADGLRSYFQKVILRPLKNFLTGTNEKDEEYALPDEQD